MEADETTYLPDAPAVTEADRVEGWRLKVLVEAGYPIPLAERIAAAPCDLHQEVELLKQGCPPDTAAAILT